jgi:hypothetical protein
VTGGPIRTAEIQTHRKTLEADLEGEPWSDAYVRDRLKELEERWPFLEREEIAGGRGEGEFADLAFLVWPLLPIPDIELEVEGVLAHLRDIQGSPLFLFGLLVTAVALGLWIRHGLPGLRELVALVVPERERPEHEPE